MFCLLIEDFFPAIWSGDDILLFPSCKAVAQWNSDFSGVRITYPNFRLPSIWVDASLWIFFFPSETMKVDTSAWQTLKQFVLMLGPL